MILPLCWEWPLGYSVDFVWVERAMCRYCRLQGTGRKQDGISPFIPSWSWGRLQKSLLQDLWLPRKPEADSERDILPGDAYLPYIQCLMKRCGFPLTRPTGCVSSAWPELFFVMLSFKSEHRLLKRLLGGSMNWPPDWRKPGTTERNGGGGFHWKNLNWPTFWDD